MGKPRPKSGYVGAKPTNKSSSQTSGSAPKLEKKSQSLAHLMKPLPRPTTAVSRELQTKIDSLKSGQRQSIRPAVNKLF